MTSHIGYIRVSSNNQNTDRQLDGIVLDKTFTEKQSGKSSNDRPQLQECLSWIREGDTLHIHSGSTHEMAYQPR
jgi:DNA invertase Pin-like site-specific DNA recombinase